MAVTDQARQIAGKHRPGMIYKPTENESKVSTLLPTQSFLKAVADARNLRDVGKRQRGQEVLKSLGSRWVVEKADMGEGSGTRGGYLVPPELTFTLLRSLGEKSFVYPRAMKAPMMGLELVLPYLDTSAATAGTSPFMAGILFGWDKPAGQMIESEPKFGQLKIRAWSLEGYVDVSNQALADMTPEGEELLVKLFGRAAAWQAEYGFLQGTGTDNGQPLGVINAPGAYQYARAAPNAIATADIAGMAGHMIPEGWFSGIWACEPSCLPQLVVLSTFFLNQSPAEDGGGSIGNLLGRPVYVTEKLPTLGKTGDLVLFDPSMYVVGVRQEVIVDADPHSLFQTNQTVFRVWLRVGGAPWLDRQVTLASGTKASSIVVLK